VLLAVFLTSCGGDGSVDLPAPTRSVSVGQPSRTASLALPTPSSGGLGSESQTPLESAGPTTTPTDETPASDSTDGSSVPSWVWWLVVGLALIAGVVALVLVSRARRRHAWDAELTAAENETGWLVREFLPQLQTAGTAVVVAGVWQVGAGRVTLVEDQLTRMEAAAPDGARAHRARVLRDAVRAARQRMEILLRSPDPATLPGEVASIATELSVSLAASARSA
jgi:hypothetical protein